MMGNKYVLFLAPSVNGEVRQKLYIDLLEVYV